MTESRYEGKINDIRNTDRGLELSLDGKLFYINEKNKSKLNHLKKELEVIKSDDRSKLDVGYHMYNEYLVVDNISVSYNNDDKVKSLWAVNLDIFGNSKESNSRSSQTASKPILSTNFGNVDLAVWEDEVKGKKVYNFKLGKFYYDSEEKVHKTNSFNLKDVSDIELALLYIKNQLILIKHKG